MRISKSYCISSHVALNSDRHPFNSLFPRTTWVSWHQIG